MKPVQQIRGALDRLGKDVLRHVGHLLPDRGLSDARATLEALRESESRHRQMFERNQAVKYLIDPATGAIVDANPAACAYYGYSRDQLLHMRIHDLNTLPKEQLEAELDLARSDQRTYFQFQHRLASGEVRDVEIHSSPIEINGRTLLYSIVHDITDRKRLEERIQYQAVHDELTGLPNRTLLLDRLQQALLAAEREGSCVALLLMDVDHFREINDTFGHEHGDLLLQQIVARLEGVLRESDTIARLGGDEFAMILLGTDEDGAETAAYKVLGALEGPFWVDQQMLDVRASIGIALYPNHGEESRLLLRRAEVAMYIAKRNSPGASMAGGFATYEAAYDQHTPGRLTLMADLRRGIESGQLCLYYQPKLDLRTDRVTAVEALVRWWHPNRGLLLPGQFIPMAEHSGLINPLTDWVLSEAVRQARTWYSAGLNLRIEVNLSARVLHNQEWVKRIADLLAQWRLPGSALGVEITESAVMTDPEAALEILTRLHDMGIAIAIDDFGTGYSSLAYLRKLPVSEVKIDRTFVKDVVSDSDACSIVRGTISLSHDLGLCTVAEGMEDPGTMALLSSVGCDFAQGYYLSPPLPPQELVRWLTKRQQSMKEARKAV